MVGAIDEGLPASAGNGDGPQVSLHTSIWEIERGEWDALAGENVSASHGWLATFEATSLGGFAPLYVVVRSGTRLLGGAVCHAVWPASAVETLDDRLLGKLRPVARALGVSFLPALICGLVRGFGSHPLLDVGPNLRARGRILDLLLGAIEEEAARRSLPTCFLDVLAGEDSLSQRLTGRGYRHVVDTPLNVLDVTWRSFDEYLRHLDGITRGARKDIRRQVNQNGKRGTVIVALDDPEPHAARLHALMEGNERAHNARSFGFSKDFFAVVKRNLGPDAVVYAAWKNGDLSAVSVLLRRGAIGYLPMVGVDHAGTGNDFTYFNVAHYRPIQDAIAGGIRRLHLGRALYDLKARRGCRVEDVKLFYKPASRLGSVTSRAWFAGLSVWKQAQLPRRVRGSRAGAAA